MRKVETPYQTRSTEPMELVLSTEDRQKIAQMAQGGGYQVLLRMMEAICIRQDIICKQVDVADEKRIVGEHRVGVGMWNLFGTVVKQVEREVRELHGEDDEEEQPTEEERMIARVVDPISRT